MAAWYLLIIASVGMVLVIVTLNFFKLRTVNYNLRGSGTKLQQNIFNSKWHLLCNYSQPPYHPGIPSSARNSGSYSVKCLRSI